MTSSHVMAGELLEGLRLQALREFGPMAVTVLEYWGVKSSRDVGQMVFNLVEACAGSRSGCDATTGQAIDRG
ncbi:MAG: Minf_1886 family protein [Chthoniobacterales bacterium]